MLNIEINSIIRVLYDLAHKTHYEEQDKGRTTIETRAHEEVKVLSEKLLNL